MKIVILTGSPHKQGTSSLLTDEFIRGAQKSKHEIYRFDTAFKTIHSCIGCEKCQTGEKDCVFHDDMLELYPKLKEADLIVFVTPLYYLGMSAQIKTAIDRFHGINKFIRHTKKKAMLIVTAGSQKAYMENGIMVSYHELLRYLEWENMGTLFAGGCYYKEDIKKTDYLQKAYELGKNI